MSGLGNIKLSTTGTQKLTEYISVENDSSQVQSSSQMRDDVIDTSSVQPSSGGLSEATLQEQLDRLTAEAGEASFGSVSKEELETALKATRMNCTVRFHGKRIDSSYALELYRALPDPRTAGRKERKVKVDFAGEKLTMDNKRELLVAIRAALAREDLLNEELMELQRKVDESMGILKNLGNDYGNFADESSLEYRSVKKAIDAQLALGDKLMELINNSAVSDTTAVEELQRKCMMRASELNQLANELMLLSTSDYYKNGAPVEVPKEEDNNVISTSSSPSQASKAPAQPEDTRLLKAGAENRALLNRDFLALLPKLSSRMHGMDLISTLKGQMEGVLQQLASFQKGVPAEKALLDIGRFDADIRRMRELLADARKNGIKVGEDSGTVRLDEALLDELDKRLQEGLERVRDISRGTLKLALQKMAKAQIEKFPLAELDGYDTYMEMFKDELPVLHEAWLKLKSVRSALDEVTGHYEGQSSLDKLKQAVREMKELTKSPKFYGDFTDQYLDDWTCSLRLKMAQYAFEHQEDALAGEFARKLEALHSDSVNTAYNKAPMNMLAWNCQMLECIVAHIDLMCQNYDDRIGANELESNRMYDAVFHGKLPMETAVEARIHSVALEDIAEGTSDEERTVYKELGKGGTNTVFRCEYANGKAYVFKPEVSGRCSLNKMIYVIGSAGAFQSQQTILNLNVATSKCAELLGLGDRVVQTKMGVVDGKFGFLMTLAPGHDSNEWDNLDAEEVKSLVQSFPGGKKALYGKIEHQLNDLDWLDRLTGQIDRHANNYKLDIGKDGSVNVQGIDNDCCFGETLVGANSYELGPGQLKTLNTQLAKCVSSVYGRSPAAKQALKTLKAMIDNLPKGQSPGSVVIDMTNCNNMFLTNAMRSTVGYQSASIPERISRETYNHLMELKAHPERLEQALGNRISQRALENTKLRLAELCAHAEKLQQENKVLENDADWEDYMDATPEIEQTEADFEEHLRDCGLPPPRYFNNFHYIHQLLTSPNRFQRDYLDFFESKF